MRTAIAALGGACMLACLGGGGEGTRPGGDLVGDWFICADPACASIDDDGLRFESGGTWVQLDGDDQDVTGDPVCALPGEGGTYTWDGQVLALNDGGQTMARFATIDGDRLMLFREQGGEEEARLRRVETFEQDPCPRVDPPPGLGGDSTQDPLAPDAG